jgi:hypothetical protein
VPQSAVVAVPAAVRALQLAAVAVRAVVPVPQRAVPARARESELQPARVLATSA